MDVCGSWSTVFNINVTFVFVVLGNSRVMWINPQHRWRHSIYCLRSHRSSIWYRRQDLLPTAGNQWRNEHLLSTMTSSLPLLTSLQVNVHLRQLTVNYLFTVINMKQGHCCACRSKWGLTDTDLCPCGETQTMSHIVESCPLTKLNGGLSRLHSADEDAVSWLINYGKWHAYEKKKKKTLEETEVQNMENCWN